MEGPIIPDFLPIMAFRQFGQEYPNSMMVIKFDTVPAGGDFVLPFYSTLDNSIIRGLSCITGNSNFDLNTYQDNGQTYLVLQTTELTDWSLTIADQNENLVLIGHPLNCLATAALRKNNSLPTKFCMNCGKSYLTYRPSAAPPAGPFVILLLFEFEEITQV